MKRRTPRSSRRARLSGRGACRAVWAARRRARLDRLRRARHRERLARPGVVAAVSTGEYPARLRASRARRPSTGTCTSRPRVGTPTAPVDPATIEERANRLFDFAASQSGLRDAVDRAERALGRAPRDAVDAEQRAYRANVLAFVRALAARGARPFLLINSDPYTGSDEAAAWWRGSRRSRTSCRRSTSARRCSTRSGSDRRQPAHARGVPPLRRAFLTIGIPVTARGDARVPERARHRRARGAAAGQGVVRGREVARALGAADRGRVEDRDRLVMGLGHLQRGRA